MTMSYNETIEFIRIVLNAPEDRARAQLTILLRANKKIESEFYAGIVKHQSGLKLTSDQWFELLSRLPNRLLRSGLSLEKILSENQLKRLPPATG